VIALAELQKREAESSSARAEFRAANDQLRVQGMDQASIDRLAKSGVIESINNVIATIPGEIVERKINKGQVVQPADALFTVADLSTLWAISEVPESNSYLIRKGQKASLIYSSFAQSRDRGHSCACGFNRQSANPYCGCADGVTNKEGQIKPGMLATMLIESQPVEKMVVPVGAVVREDNHDHVFVRIDDDLSHGASQAWP
jgi:cobalt-zinc-cadmium efflux system membrane fusion protein